MRWTRVFGWIFWVGGVLGSVAACRETSTTAGGRAGSGTGTGTGTGTGMGMGMGTGGSSGAGGRVLPQLLGVAWIEHLDLEDGHEAYVTPVIGAREARPLIVAVHGAGDRAEWACGGWRMVASEYAFVVCPQGLKMDAMRFGWDSAETIRKRVKSAVVAARARFGEYIAEGPTLYVGFSQGATLAGPTLLDAEQPFRIIGLAEGGYGLIRDQRFLAKLSDRGVQRVLLACGTPACFTTMKAAQPNFDKAQIELLIGGDPSSGHNLNGEMQAGLQRVWPAFVAGLPNWRGFKGR